MTVICVDRGEVSSYEENNKRSQTIMVGECRRSRYCTIIPVAYFIALSLY